MSTSGTTIFSLKRDEIINAALRKISVLSGGSSPAAYEVANAAQALNSMVKSFAADGMPLWAVQIVGFYPTAGLKGYNAGPGLAINISKPLRILQAWRLDTPTSMNVPIQLLPIYDYNLLPANSASGVPISMTYLPQDTYGTINLWPAPINSTTQVIFTFLKPFDDFNASTDDLDFPSYWTDAIIYGLAWRLCGEYGVPVPDRQVLAKEAEMFHQKALEFGYEDGSLFIQPTWWGNR